MKYTAEQYTAELEKSVEDYQAAKAKLVNDIKCAYAAGVISGRCISELVEPVMSRTTSLKVMKNVKTKDF